MTPKTLVLDKTIVTDVKVLLADAHRRQNIHEMSKSVKVPAEGRGVRTGDVTVSVTNPLNIEQIEGFLLIDAWSSFNISFKNNGIWSPLFLSTGIFVFHGAIQEVRVTSEVALRLSYVCA